MDRQLVPRVLLALLTVLSLIAVVTSLQHNGSGGSSHRPKAFGAPSFGFAGYTAPSTVTQISARWRVPFIDSKIPIDAAASTWIAAESADGHFIQLGTTENVYGNATSFQIFWSDPVVHFEPQSLGTVRSGNLIAYSMNKTSAGWVLRFDDRTTSQSKRVTIRYGQSTTFNEGQWIQEDPTTAAYDIHLPYPEMSLVTIAHLQLNRQAPQLRFREAQTMSSANGVFLIPSRVRHDHFTFRHAKGAALQYLQDALPANTAYYPFFIDAQDNVTPTSLVDQELIGAIDQFIANVKSQRWPKATRGDIANIVARNRDLRRLVKRWPVAPAKLPDRFYNELQNLSASQRMVTSDLHVRLGLPPLD